MAIERRTKYTDPDFRREPKTNLYCARCQKDIKGTYRWAFFVNGEMLVVHPEDVSRGLVAVDDTGWLRLGLDCARQLGFEWSVKDIP